MGRYYVKVTDLTTDSSYRLWYMMVRYLENMLLLLSYGYEDWLFIKIDEKLLREWKISTRLPPR